MTKNGSSQPVEQPDISPPLWLLMELTYRCPLQCPYCSNPVNLGEPENELDTETWLDVLEQAREMGAVQLGLSGGEPLLRKDLETIVSRARALGFYSNLITSGIGLNEKRIKVLKEAGLDHIQISFQSSDPDLNDAIAGKKRAFQQKKEMARLVKAHGFPMVLNFVISKQNIHQIPQIMDLSCELSADYVELATAQYYGWALENRDQLLPSWQEIETAESYVNAFREQQNGEGPKFIFVTPDYYESRPKACMSGWGSLFLNISPEGKALPCHSAALLDLPFLNVREHSLRHIWFESEGFNHFRGYDWMPEPCRSCEDKEKDYGGCRCQAMMLTGDAHNTDPVCERSPHHHLIEQARGRAASGTGCHSETLARSFANSQVILREKL